MPKLEKISEDYIQIAASTTNQKIKSGKPILVNYLTVTASANAAVSILDNDGVEYLSIRCAPHTTIIHPGFLASNGVAVTTGSNVVCTVFYAVEEIK